jgi:hypothetical protein
MGVKSPIRVGDPTTYLYYIVKMPWKRLPSSSTKKRTIVPRPTVNDIFFVRRIAGIFLLV